MSAQDESTVAQFYAQFPYPFPQVQDDRFVPSAAGILGMLSLETRLLSGREITVLDVGCGTGQRILSAARAFASVNFTAIDISASSIAIARSQAEAWGVKNIEFANCRCENLEWSLKFDVILATGVLHHVQQPKALMADIQRHLKDHGIFLAWVYHSYGEHARLLDRDLLRLLMEQEHYTATSAVNLMRELNLTISSKRYGPSFGVADSEIGNLAAMSRDADAYLNPHVVAYSFDGVANLAKEAGFGWISYEHVCFNEQDFLLSLDVNHQRRPSILKIAEMLPSIEAQSAFWKLTPSQRLRVIELRTKPTGFSFACGSSSALPRLSTRARSTVQLLEEAK